MSVIAGSETLGEFRAEDSAVTSADDLMTCSELGTLDISGCKTGNIKKRCEALSLSVLDLSGCGVTDIKAFSDCTVLTELYLSRNGGLDSLDGLHKQNQATLEKLSLSSTGLDGDDLGYIGGCTKLTSLWIDNVSTENLSFCKGLGSLETLYAQGCGIKDVSGISACNCLQDIYLGFNNISDVSPLGKIEFENNEVEHLDLGFNDIKDVSSLKGMTYDTLILCGNDKKVVSTLNTGIKGLVIAADWYDGINDSNLTVGNAFSHPYILDVPADQQVSLENAFSGISFDAMSRKDFYTVIMADPDNRMYADTTTTAAMYKAKN